MAFGATMSVMGIYNYCNGNPDIFSGFKVPEGVDRDGLINKILFDTSEMECLYPNPLVLQLGITAWADTNIQQWSRLWETCTYEYDPFENYDITEEYKRTPNLTHNTNRTPNLIQTSKNSGTDTSDSFVVPFNDNANLVQNGQQKATLGTQNTINNTGSEQTNITEGGSDEFIRHTYGDASVRSASQVILEMRQERLWSFYQYVIDSFIDNFCNKCFSL